MHQTHYVDIDEEITSVVDRLRKSSTPDVVLVIPQRALFLQSNVNLRLLRREADKLKKRVVIVTQDPLGTRFAEKAGLLVQSSMVGIREEEEVREPVYPKIQASEQKPPLNAFSSGEQPRQSVGTNDFFDRSASRRVSEPKVVHVPVMDMQHSTPRTAAKSRTIPAKRSRLSDLSRVEGGVGAPSKQVVPSINSATSAGYAASRLGQNSDAPWILDDTVFPPSPNAERFEQWLGRGGDKSPAQLQAADAGNNLERSKRHDIKDSSNFTGAGEAGAKAKPTYSVVGNPPERTASRHMGRAVLFFGVSCLALAVLAGVYLFVPSAVVRVWVKAGSVEIKTEIPGGSSVVASAGETDRAIPVKRVEREWEETIAFAATGRSHGADQKARGSVNIANSFSTEPQTLIATTRLLSADGKLFRLMETVIVPGYRQDGDRIEPGIIEAKVTADQSGEDYNIDPATFTIPGFLGTAKYAKFSVTSLKPMMGGGTSSDGVAAVSQEDLENAKQQAEETAAAKIIQIIRSEMPVGSTLLDGASARFVTESVPSLEAGVAAQGFEYRVRMKMRALVFSESDAEVFMEKLIRRQNGAIPENARIRFDVQYSPITVDFEQNIIILGASGKSEFETPIDEDRLRRDLLDQSQEELRDFLDRHEEIARMEVEFWPPYFPGSRKIPQFERRLRIEVVKSDGA